MKKTLLMIVAISLVIAAVFAFSACNTVEDAEELSFDRLPETVYVVNDDISNFAIVIRKGDISEFFEYYRYKNDITIENFNTSEPGTREATVTYRGQSITFTYTVKEPNEESDFSAGAGTLDNPYVIKTEAEFIALNDADTEGKYYELGADIEIVSKLESTYVIETPFKGTLSGASNYKISVKKSDTTDETSMFLFNILSNATIKDLKLEFNANSAVSMAYCAEGENFINNVDVYGNIFTLSNNYSAYLLYNFRMSNGSIAGSAKTTFNNCENHANVTSLTYIGGFVGFAGWTGYDLGSNAGFLTFNDCANYGNLSGSSVGILVANGSKNYVCNITVKDFLNEGKIGYTSYGDFVVGEGYNKSLSEGEIAITRVANGENGSITKFASTNGTINDDGYIQFTATDEVKRAAIVFGYYAVPAAGGTIYVQGFEDLAIEGGGYYVNGELKLLDVKPMSSEDVENAGYEYIKGFETWKIQEIDEVEYYIHNNGVTANATLSAVKPGTTLAVYLFWMDDEGSILAADKLQ